MGVVGSFYDLPSEIAEGSEDLVTSNEGLHWQPPYQMSEIIYSQLPAGEREQYERQALMNFKLALANIFSSLKEGGIAVLQFGHEGQLQKLWDLVRDTLNEELFRKYKPSVNFPLFYPTVEDIEESLHQAGFTPENISIQSFDQDLTEDTPVAIASFLSAFTRPGFSQFFSQEDLDAFYKKIEERLGAMDLAEFRKGQWHRTLLRLKK